MSKKRRSVDNGKDKDLVAPQKDNSIWVCQKEKLRDPVNIKLHYQLTPRQSVILETAMDKSSKAIFIDGYWGVGKSELCVLAGLKLLNDKKIDGIVYIRNSLESTSSGKVGLLAGGIEDKMAPYNAILFDKLNNLLSKPDVDRLKKEERLECIPVSFLQGKTFTCKAVIIDEASSLTFDDLMLAISRIGERCKVFIIGDSTFQLTLGHRSGFKKFFDFFNDMESKENGVFAFELKSSSDILRSGLIRFVMKKTGIIPRERDDSSENDWTPTPLS